MRLIKETEAVKVTMRESDHKIRVMAKDITANKVWSFTVYKTNLEEVKTLLIKAFEKHTGDKFPEHRK